MSDFEGLEGLAYPYESMVIIWTLARLEILKKKGLIGGGGKHLTMKGQFVNAMNDDPDFRPSDDDIKSALVALGVPAGLVEDMLLLVKHDGCEGSKKEPPAIVR